MKAFAFIWYVTAWLAMAANLYLAVRLSIKLARSAPFRQSRHAWYTPSSWVSSLLFEVAQRAPNEAGMVVAGLYGIVEVCGLKRVVKIIYANRNAVLKALLRRKNVS